MGLIFGDNLWILQPSITLADRLIQGKIRLLENGSIDTAREKECISGGRYWVI